MAISISKWAEMEREDGYVAMTHRDRKAVRNDPFFFLPEDELAKRNGFPKPVHILFENGKPCDKWITPSR